jgi:o-succinylbenzoate synthase
MASKLEQLDVYRLSLPLTKLYRLSFIEVSEFDTVLVYARDSEGRSGWGEATLLTGYTEETIDGSYRLACEMAAAVIGLSLKKASRKIGSLTAGTPFTATALLTALEMLQGSPLLDVRGGARIPLLALLNGETAQALETEIETHLLSGYRTFKLKVGFDADKDLRKVRAAQSILAGRGKIRIDANQGYSIADACRFASSLSPESIELLEQPCRADDWSAASSVAAVSAVPLMLDESIYSMDDVERAAESGAASFIKFKLMKAGGLEKLRAALDRIRALGMTPVLGNGVACDLGCWMEACIAARAIDNAGEMNGFLKTVDSLFRQPLVVEDGVLVLPQSFEPEIDRAALERHLKDRYPRAA